MPPPTALSPAWSAPLSSLALEMASTPAIRRLTRYLEQLKAKPVPNVVAGPVSDSNLFIWSANLTAAFGEPGTPIFSQQLSISSQAPP